MIKKVIRIFEKCAYCPFCSDKLIREIAGYHIKYLCKKSEYKEIDRKDLDMFPD